MIKNISTKNKIVLFILFIFTISFFVFAYMFYSYAQKSFQKLKMVQYDKIEQSYKNNLHKHLFEHYSALTKQYLSKESDNFSKLHNLHPSDPYIKRVYFIPYKSDKSQSNDTVTSFEKLSGEILYTIKSPVFQKNSLAGAVVLQIDPKKLLDMITFFNTIDGALVVHNNENLTIQENFIKDQNLLEYLKKHKQITAKDKIIIEDRFFYPQSFDIKDMKGSTIGSYIFFS